MNKKTLILLMLVLYFIPVRGTIIHKPYKPLPGQQVSFTVSVDSKYRIVQWHMGDGVIKRGDFRTVRYKYNKPGFYTIRAKYRLYVDHNHWYYYATKTINVTEYRNIIPIPSSGRPGQSIKFIAQSFITDKLYWDFGDGNRTTGSHQISHIYNNPGTYAIKVREGFKDCSVTITARINITR